MKKVMLPEGSKGPWKIEKFEITRDEARLINIRMLMNDQGNRAIDPGEYTKLVHTKHGVVMSDTPAEMRDHYEAVENATGNILINGLGLGMVLYNALIKKEVKHATVIEISPDLIDLVGPFYKKQFNGRLTIIQASAFDFQPEKGVYYDMVWHDIWNTITIDNWEEYKQLHRKYGKRCKWQGSWARDLIIKDLRSYKRELKKDYSHILGFKCGTHMEMLNQMYEDNE